MLTPLERWIAGKIGLPSDQPLTREALERYQLRMLRETVVYARKRSLFYGRKLHGAAAENFATLNDLRRLPFTTPSDLRERELGFLCVSHGDVERIVTIQSSGTTSPPKRVHFTAEDLELTVDFFHHGMSTLVCPGERVLILMPGELPGSVGDLLVRGLVRLGAEGIVHGLVTDPVEVIRKIVNLGVTTLVGLPVQVLSLARHPDAELVPKGQLTGVLLSADYVPQAVVRELAERWEVPVFNHYGMTEMGLGGAVECRALCGCHIREADLLFEVVDPVSGEPLPDGELGEVVCTTLTRRGMPLIRYRTGDLARFLTEPCPCGTILRRLERVKGRLGARVKLPGGRILDITELDETLFTIPSLVDYQVAVSGSDERARLDLSIATAYGMGAAVGELVREAVQRIPSIEGAFADGSLAVGDIGVGAFARSITVKRTILDQRKERSC